ncbi:MAG: VapE domain-containing protein [Enterococcus faecalis]
MQVQFDYCLDFVGKQGTGKVPFYVRCSKFYTEVETFTEKDDLLKMAGSWLVR